VKGRKHVWYISLPFQRLIALTQARLWVSILLLCMLLNRLEQLFYEWVRTFSVGDYGYDYASAGSQLDGPQSYLDIVPKTEDVDMDEGTVPLSEDELWIVINSFFSDKGLVNQQLSSFNEFMETTIVEVVEEHGSFTLDQTSQGGTRAMDATVRRLIGFDIASRRLRGSLYRGDSRSN
jgi:hypothetical protein